LITFARMMVRIMLIGILILITILTITSVISFVESLQNFLQGLDL